jgi:hypothetical protein
MNANGCLKALLFPFVFALPPAGVAVLAFLYPLLL